MSLIDTFRNLFYRYTQTYVKLIRYDDILQHCLQKGKIENYISAYQGRTG